MLQRRGSKLLLRQTAAGDKILVPTLWETAGIVCILCGFFTRLHEDQFVFFSPYVNRLITNQLMGQWTFYPAIELTHGEPVSCGPRPMIVDGGLVDVRLIRGLGGERYPAASYALLTHLKTCLLFADIGEGSIIVCRPFLHINQTLFYQTPIPHPLHIIAGRVICVTLG